MTDESKLLAAEIKLHIEEKCGEIRTDVAAIDARQELMRDDIATLKKSARNIGAVAGTAAAAVLAGVSKALGIGSS